MAKRGRRDQGGALRKGLLWPGFLQRPSRRGHALLLNAKTLENLGKKRENRGSIIGASGSVFPNTHEITKKKRCVMQYSGLMPWSEFGNCNWCVFFPAKDAPGPRASPVLAHMGVKARSRETDCCPRETDSKHRSDDPTEGRAPHSEPHNFANRAQTSKTLAAAFRNPGPLTVLYANGQHSGLDKEVGTTFKFLEPVRASRPRTIQNFRVLEPAVRGAPSPAILVICGALRLARLPHCAVHCYRCWYSKRAGAFQQNRTRPELNL